MVHRQFTRLEVIPVIDLLDGLVVHARYGQRQQYQPIRTPLCDTAQPLAIVEQLLSIYPFKTLYIADLNSIMGNRDNLDQITAISNKFPCLTIWLDRGCFDQPPEKPKIVPVIGTESLNKASLPLLAQIPQPFILSLDFSNKILHGPDRILKETSCWPKKVIIMNLALVGSKQGPDFQRLRFFKSNWPNKEIIAAGGVRDEADLDELKALGVNAALVASALHSGAISSAIISRIMETGKNRLGRK